MQQSWMTVFAYPETPLQDKKKKKKRYMTINCKTEYPVCRASTARIFAILAKISWQKSNHKRKKKKKPFMYIV